MKPREMYLLSKEGPYSWYKHFLVAPDSVNVSRTGFCSPDDRDRLCEEGYQDLAVGDCFLVTKVIKPAKATVKRSAMPALVHVVGPRCAGWICWDFITKTQHFKRIER